MSPPNTDPWGATAAPGTDPGSALATTVDDSDASVTRELAAQPGTDPGLGETTLAPDTILDEDGRADDDELVAQLKRLGGRPPLHAHFQADSAGRYAASYDVVTKPVKSRAAAFSRTDPFGVIVAPDTLPPAPAKRSFTEPMLVAAAASGATPARSPSSPPLPAPPADGTELQLAPLERTHARRQASRGLVSTVSRHRVQSRWWSRSRALYGGLVLLTLAVITIGFFVARDPSPSVDPTSSAAASATTAAATALTSRREPTIPTIASSQPSSALSARAPEPTAEPTAALGAGAPESTATRVPAAPAPSSRPRPHGVPGASSSAEIIPKPAAPSPQPSSSASTGGVWRL